MVDQEEVRLQKMGLTKLEGCDTFLEHEDEWSLISLKPNPKEPILK